MLLTQEEIRIWRPKNVCRRQPSMVIGWREGSDVHIGDNGSSPGRWWETFEDGELRESWGTRENELRVWACDARMIGERGCARLFRITFHRLLGITFPRLVLLRQIRARRNLLSCKIVVTLIRVTVVNTSLNLGTLGHSSVSFQL